MNILVTGANGFIGRQLCKELVKKHNVRIILRSPLSNFPNAFIGDISDKKFISKACRNIDVIYHLAAKLHDDGNEFEFIETNINGTRNLLECARKSHVKLFIYFSSLAIYGISGSLRNRFYEIPIPSTHYSKTKYAGENICKEFKNLGFNILIVRIPMVYDFNEPNKEFGTLVKFVKFGVVLLIGNGDNLFDIISRDTLVKYSSKLVSQKRDRVIIYIEETVSMSDLIEKIRVKIGKKCLVKLKIPYWLLLPFVAVAEVISKKFHLTPIMTLNRLIRIKESTSLPSR